MVKRWLRAGTPSATTTVPLMQGAGWHSRRGRTPAAMFIQAGKKKKRGCRGGKGGRECAAARFARENGIEGPGGCGFESWLWRRRMVAGDSGTDTVRAVQDQRRRRRRGKRERLLRPMEHEFWQEVEEA